LWDPTAWACTDGRLSQGRATDVPQQKGPTGARIQAKKNCDDDDDNDDNDDDDDDDDVDDDNDDDNYDNNSNNNSMELSP
jgi:hypothetical protein